MNAPFKFVAPVLAALLTVASASCNRNSQSQLVFDSKAWKDANSGEKNDRYRMTDSLRALLETGTPQSKVHELLGTPDATSDKLPDRWLNSNPPFDAYHIRFYYNMIDWDTDYFILEYDTENRVRATHVGTVQG